MADAARAGAAAAGPIRLTVLLMGRPNSGKSSLFNAITGGRAKVGNFAGITVDVLESQVALPVGGQARIVDLPGTYSLAASVDPESDEGIARAYLERVRAEGQPVLVAQVLDSTQLPLNLRFTAELLAVGLPLALLVSHRDVLEQAGSAVDVPLLERELGCPVLWVGARSAATRGQVLEALERWAGQGLAASPARPFDPQALAEAVIRTPAAAPAPKLPGAKGVRRLDLFRRTAAVDRYLMHPLLGPLAFLLLMGALFTAVLVVAEPASRLVGAGADLLAAGIHGVIGHGKLSAFLCEGVIGGAGTVIQFLPQIVVLTIVLELIEASGYLARGAYLLDRLLRLFGLGGRSFVPLLMGHACAVPAISATRTIREPGQRLRTMLVIPLMTCSARIPAYVLLIETFFPTWNAIQRGFLFLALYGAGLVAGAGASAVIKGTVQRGRATLPLMLELPPYRMPQLQVVARTAWRASVHFLRDVGTVIVVVSAILWVLLSIPIRHATPQEARLAGVVPERTLVMNRSVAAQVGKALEPVTRPLGFDWRINVGLIGSFGARELMVSTMGIIFGIENAGSTDVSHLSAQIQRATGPDGKRAYSVATGLSLLAFFVLACQCMSTLSALRRETRGWRWPLFVLGYTYVAAYACAFLVFHLAQL